MKQGNRRCVHSPYGFTPTYFIEVGIAPQILFNGIQTKKGKRKQYRKSEKFQDLVKERLASIPTSPEFEYENAIQNEILVQQYMEYEPTALELLELGCEEIVFEHIHSQYFDALLEMIDFEEEAEA